MTAVILCDNCCVGGQFSSVEMQLDVAPVNDLHSEKLQLDVYVLDEYRERKILREWGSAVRWTLSRGLIIQLWPPAVLYQYIVGQLPTGTRKKPEAIGYWCGCVVTIWYPNFAVLDSLTLACIGIFRVAASVRCWSYRDLQRYSRLYLPFSFLRRLTVDKPGARTSSAADA